MAEQETEYSNRQPEDCAPSGNPREVLDVDKPFWELGDKARGHADLVRQDGYIYGWSESNVQYELLGQVSPSTPPGRYYSRTGLRVPDYTSITRSVSGGL